MVAREHVAAVVHFEFMCELYWAQVEAGRYFLHERPATAASLHETPTAEVLAHKDVQTVVGDRCQYQQEDEKGNSVEKPIKYMSNAEEVLKSVSRR